MYTGTIMMLFGAVLVVALGLAALSSQKMSEPTFAVIHVPRS
jgi:hypothetical protein